MHWKLLGFHTDLGIRSQQVPEVLLEARIKDNKLTHGAEPDLIADQESCHLDAGGMVSREEPLTTITLPDGLVFTCFTYQIPYLIHVLENPATNAEEAYPGIGIFRRYLFFPERIVYIPAHDVPLLLAQLKPLSDPKLAEEHRVVSQTVLDAANRKPSSSVN